jgi:predicted aminopeptidase
MTRFVRIVTLGLLAALLAGCFYWQAIGGQLELLRKRTPIDKLLADPNVDPKLKTTLASVAEIRRFASEELKLPDNDSYTSYVDLGRPYVVWNVVATPEFAVEPKRWCFPFVGCVGYRGFFEREAAEKFAAGLAHEGLDTYSGGSTAYSTLGYFADPVLSTMIGGGEQYVASLLFHELTHQKLYVKDDSEFSEALATAIEEYGTERWLGSHGTADALTLYRSRLRYRSDFADLIAAQQTRLRAVFATSGTVEEKRAAKARAYEAMRADYSVMKTRWGGTTDYDAWFAAPLNNATLAAVATYRRWVPALRARLEEVGLAAFYQEMTVLSKLTVAERAARLQAWLDALSPTGVVPQAG